MSRIETEDAAQLRRELGSDDLVEAAAQAAASTGLHTKIGDPIRISAGRNKGMLSQLWVRPDGSFYTTAVLEDYLARCVEQALAEISERAKGGTVKLSQVSELLGAVYQQRLLEVRGEDYAEITSRAVDIQGQIIALDALIAKAALAKEEKRLNYSKTEEVSKKPVVLTHSQACEITVALQDGISALQAYRVMNPTDPELPEMRDIAIEDMGDAVKIFKQKLLAQ